MLKIVRKAEPYLEDSSDSRQTKYISTTIVDSIEIKRKYDSGIAIKQHENQLYFSVMFTTENEIIRRS